MSRKPYPTDLTDEQWERLDSLLPKPKSGTPWGGHPVTRPWALPVLIDLIEADWGGVVAREGDRDVLRHAGRGPPVAVGRGGFAAGRR